MLIWVELDGGVCYELGDDSFLLIIGKPCREINRDNITNDTSANWRMCMTGVSAEHCELRAPQVRGMGIARLTSRILQIKSNKQYRQVNPETACRLKTSCSRAPMPTLRRITPRTFNIL